MEAKIVNILSETSVTSYNFVNLKLSFSSPESSPSNDTNETSSSGDENGINGSLLQFFQFAHDWSSFENK